MPRAKDPGAAERQGRSAIIRWIDAVTSGLNAVGSALIFFLMCLICADVASRFLLNAPIVGVTEIVEISIVVIVFLQLADTTRRDKLTRADSLVGVLRLKRPDAARAVDGVAALAGLTLMLLLIYAIVPAIFNDYRRGFYVGTPGLFTFPTWPSKLMIAIGLVVTSIQLALMAVRAALGRVQQQFDD